MAAKAILDKHLKTKDWNVNLDPDSLEESLPHIPSNSIVIDRLIGGIPNAKGVLPCPGVPRGKIMQIYGNEGAGKTTFALEVAASVIASGGVVGYIDWENAIVPSYAEALGVPVADNTKFMLCQPTTLEEGIFIAAQMAQCGVDLIVFDSIAAGVPRKSLEKKPEDFAEAGQVGALARIWSLSLPKLQSIISSTNTAIIGISQIREKIGSMGYGPSTDTQGGKAWKFFAAIRMKLTRKFQEKDTRVNRFTNTKEEFIMGAKVEAKLDKCKVSAQQGNSEIFYIRQGEGIDNYRTIIEVAKAHNLVKTGGGGWFTWEDVKVQGLTAFRERMINTEGAFEKLYSQIEPILHNSDVDLASVPTEEERAVAEMDDLLQAFD